MSGNIVWLASYPKSGNTWFRSFIGNLLSAPESPLDINSLPGEVNARTLFDTLTGIDSANLFPEEIDRLRPGLYNRLSEAVDAPCYFKIHDAYQYLPGGQPFFPVEATRCTIYIVRNLLDVVPSFAHFLDRDIDQVISELNEDGRIFNREVDNTTNMLPQKVCSWGEHVESWLEAPAGMRLHLMRYEDMLKKPEESFTRAARAIGLDHSEEEIRRAVEFSSFDALKAMENKDGFQERPPKAESFFRKGRAGSWRDSLTSDQADRVIEKHRGVMRRLGYLDAAGRVVDP